MDILTYTATLQFYTKLQHIQANHLLLVCSCLSGNIQTHASSNAHWQTLVEKTLMSGCHLCLCFNTERAAWNWKSHSTSVSVLTHSCHWEVHPATNSSKAPSNLLLNLPKPTNKTNLFELDFLSPRSAEFETILSLTDLLNPRCAEGWKWVNRNLPRNCNHAVGRSFRHTGGTKKAKTDFLSVQVNMPALPLHIHYCLHESLPANSFLHRFNCVSRLCIQALCLFPTLLN